MSRGRDTDRTHHPQARDQAPRKPPHELTNCLRVRLAHLPTPLEPLPRLTKALDGPEIWVKGDDCTGLSTGGNKTANWNT